MKKLSIIIPCYNCADRITSLLDILENQYNQEVEVILINDGSTDNTENIIRNFVNGVADKDFSLYSYPNAGAAKARTIGLEKAQGEYIAFIDSDDSVSPDYVVRLLECMVQNLDVIYYASVQQFDNCNQLKPKVHFGVEKIYTCTDAFLRSQLERGQWSAAVWTFAFKKALFVSCGARFTERIAHEDHIFSLAIVAHAKTIFTIKNVLYVQHITEGSLTNSAKTISYIEDRHAAYIEAMALVRKMFNTKTADLYRKWSLAQCLALWSGMFRLRSLLLKPEFLAMSKKSPQLFITVLLSILKK